MKRSEWAGVRLATLLALHALAVLPLAAGPRTKPLGDRAGARVTYVSGESAYIDAGSESGFEKGEVLDVILDGAVVGKLRIKYLSSDRASCEVIEGDPLEIRQGSVVREGEKPAGGTAVDTDPGNEDSGERPVDTDVQYTRVSHVDQFRVFVDSGENDGLRGGDQLPVVRDGATVAYLEVTDVSTESAACKIVDGIGSIDVGDAVRLPNRPADPSVTSLFPSPDFTVVAATPFDSPTAVMAPNTVRAEIIGRVGVRYIAVRDRTPDGSEFSQPGLDLRLDAGQLANGHIDLAIDVRSRMTYRSINDEGRQESQTRVYRLGASVHDQRGRFRLSVGRQFSPSLASVSTFDGAMASYNGAHFSIGMFGGTQPDPIDYGYSDQIREYGGFVQLHNRPESRTQWSLTSGAIGSYQDGEINREYGYFQVLVASRVVSLYALQEVDYNRDWKLDAGEDPVEPTSTFVNLGLRITRSFDIRAGYDSRRNVRLYRDLITPVTEFDDTFREGYWAGFTQRFAKRFRFGLSGKRSTSETAGDADTYTLLFGANQIARRLSFYYRGSAYRNDTNEGRLQTLTTSIAVTRQFRLNLNGGLRTDQDLEVVEEQSELVWYGIGGDLNFARNWFAQLTFERTTGDSQDNDQVYFSTTYRF